jgi:hypothetical protein
LLSSAQKFVFCSTTILYIAAEAVKQFFSRKIFARSD